MKNSRENKWELFEQNYKKSVDSKEELVNPDLWNKISQKLDLREEKKKVSWWLNNNARWAYAAILLMSIGLSWLKFIPELIESYPHDLKLKSISLNQKSIKKLNPIPISLSPSIKKVQQIKAKSIPSKFDVLEKSIEPVKQETLAQVSTAEEIIQHESKSNTLDQNSVEQDDAVWVRVDIKLVSEPESISKDIEESSPEIIPIRKKARFYTVVKQISHVLKGEFHEARLKNQDEVFVENKIHQVVNQYIKTGEIIKLKFQ